MLSYNVHDVEHQAARVDGEVAPDDAVWTEGDQLPATPVHATGRLSKAGPNRYYWSGRIEGQAVLPCRRCLAEATVTVREDVHLVFVDPADEVADDPDTYWLDPRAIEIDLRPAVREQWLLATPRFVLCREECKGLCPRCGADLNAGPCECPPKTDPRWESLRKMRGTPDSR